jgi:hypothetical protein
VIWGLIMIAVGAWFLLRTLGFRLPGMGQMWPIFPTLVGLSMFVGWLFTGNKRENHGIMIPATINLLIGLFFFGFTMGVFPWSAMGVLWPVFPLIVGISFFVAWVFSLFSNWGLLIPGGITATVGIVGLGFTLSAQSGLFAWIVRLWPLALIALGVLVLVGGLLSGFRTPSRSSGAAQAAAPEAGGLESYEPAGGETTSQEFKRQDE